MHEIIELSFGLLGCICLISSIRTPGFPNKNSNARALLALAAMTIIFIIGLDGSFKSVSLATPIEIWGLLGRVMGLIGVVTAVFMRITKKRNL